MALMDTTCNEEVDFALITIGKQIYKYNQELFYKENDISLLQEKVEFLEDLLKKNNIDFKEELKQWETSCFRD